MSNQFGQSLGPSQRQLRVGELVRRTLAEVFSRNQIYDETLSGVSITVGEVSMSADLKIAHVFVSPLGGNKSKEVVEALNNNKVEIRKIVTKNVKLKFSPELKFLLDTTFDNMDAMRTLFDKDEIKRDTQDE
ncbi:MAG: 30S ribosome-binding factor RbfA [Rhodospirillaceae bacterium]|jgi:ribosome-binding factor A|nr:30S ribosome-binding factor RbfA [Paracoccaceae bacterium]MBT4353830.1 30S ribosome-binding factor RbfA [Rhodospirillaceae bacterium]MDA9122562.1 30S ribosome-binding factor RbfA [Paracoccaceae bacterium]|tara:strand:+ start:4188 stop:4583 length:396 start_codon:yes stop_codon:yes gene_type:complete